MTTYMQIRLLAVLEAELAHVSQVLKGGELWAAGQKEVPQSHKENMEEIRDYQRMLCMMRDKVERGETLV